MTGDLEQEIIAKADKIVSDFEHGHAVAKALNRALNPNANCAIGVEFRPVSLDYLLVAWAGATSRYRLGDVLDRLRSEAPTLRMTIIEEQLHNNTRDTETYQAWIGGVGRAVGDFFTPCATTVDVGGGWQESKLVQRAPDEDQLEDTRTRLRNLGFTNIAISTNVQDRRMAALLAGPGPVPTPRIAQVIAQGRLFAFGQAPEEEVSEEEIEAVTEELRRFLAEHPER